jgi:aryl-alcohol dehydrogenase-like predicted oxidoreductase
VVEQIADLARTESVTPSQLALAWVMAEQVVPIAGTKRRRYLDENAAAAQLQLDPQVLSLLDALAPPGVAAGERDTLAGLNANYR